ncbi:sterol desaturase family protein [Massilia psychrophila]|jgi:sterol desaturase/sphingolipid hydroxylase (fatty acid hydroxylase superfamily)|uniref:Uncharacterized protein n=1 Tax=Massilia psychrophila TaxID=1603353 RepID=A0A2G8T4W6_9BURK|nr:sterol desaturase family protein [Massilia psychrophila]PIL41013.1 hypothetical protein CR103_04585 [Massilia psychrophila]GGE68370.1 hypothetical protein GCM10008020_11030 [Massilia psychrophila]
MKAQLKLALGALYDDLTIRPVYYQALLLQVRLARLAFEHRVAIDNWSAVLLLFVGQEFCYYWFHHTAHHTPNTPNLSAAFRIGVLSKLTGTAFFFLPLIWLGVAPRTVFAVLTLNLLY